MLFLHLLAVSGCFLFVFYLCRLYVMSGIQKLFPTTSPHHTILFIVSISWTLSVGLRGTIGLWGFCLDIAVQNVIVLNAMIGGTGWFLTLIWLRKERGVSFKFNILPIQLSKYEFLALILLLIVLSVYAYCTLVPWNDWDEMAIYGKSAKDYALGLGFTSFLEIGNTFTLGTKLVEILTAQSIYVVSDTYLARTFRLLNLVFCVLGLFSLLRCLKVKRFWALTGVVVFLLPPDLHYLGTSLKVDSTVMVFEFSAFMCILMILLSFLPENRDKIQNRFPLTIAAVFLALFAAASRLSGLYLLFFVMMIAGIVGLTQKCSWKKKMFYFTFLPSISFFCFVLFLFTAWKLGNPFYPFNPWPLPEGEGRVLEGWKLHYNIYLPPVIQQIYLVAHLALGLELISMKLGWDFIPHAAHHGISMLWLTPALLTVFIVPFFRKDRVIMILSGIFLYWLITWSSGIHYSRVFLAGSSVTILIATIIASYSPAYLSKFQNFLRLNIRLLLILILIAFIPYQFYRTWHYPHDWRSLFSINARYKAKVDLFQDLHNYIFIDIGEVNLKETKNRIKTTLPSYEEAQEISKQLSLFPLAVVHSDFTRALHIYFDHGVFLERPLDSQEKVKYNKGADCFLNNKKLSYSQIQIRELRDRFPEVLFENADWRLLCRKKHESYE